MPADINIGLLGEVLSIVLYNDNDNYDDHNDNDDDDNKKKYIRLPRESSVWYSSDGAHLNHDSFCQSRFCIVH